MDDDRRAFLLNEDGKSHRLADLPRKWDRPGRTAPDVYRVLLVWHYNRIADTKPWAWEGLCNLLNHLRDNEEEIPDHLLSWALDFACGRRTPPKLVGRKPDDDRNARILRTLEDLQRDRVTRAEAIRQIAELMNLSPEAVISAVRKAQRERLWL